MREFMTRVSDYISERRNDPEKNGNFLIPCMLGIVILIIIILCLLLLWRKNANGKEEELTEETYEYIPEVVMAEPSNDEELKQEYLSNMQYLEEKVEDLLQSLTEIQKSLEETVITQQGDNVYLQEQIGEITEDIKNMITRLQNTQNNLYDITDMINIISKETIPVIQEQISEMEKQINQVNADISNIYSKIEALETTDSELKNKIDEIEGKMKSSIEQNITDITNKFNNMNRQIEEIEGRLKLSIEQNAADVTNRFNNVNVQIEEIEGGLKSSIEQNITDVTNKFNNVNVQIEEMIKRMEELTSQFLRYRYEEESNTLYLYTD